PRLRRPALFPYTTLFRSGRAAHAAGAAAGRRSRARFGRARRALAWRHGRAVAEGVRARARAGLRADSRVHEGRAAEDDLGLSRADRTSTRLNSSHAWLSF